MSKASLRTTTMYASLRNLDYEIRKLLYMRRDSDIAAYLGCAVERVTKVRAKHNGKPKSPETSVLRNEAPIGFTAGELDANRRIRRASERLAAAIKAAYAPAPRPAGS